VGKISAQKTFIGKKPGQMGISEQPQEEGDRPSGDQLILGRSIDGVGGKVAQKKTIYGKEKSESA